MGLEESIFLYTVVYGCRGFPLLWKLGNVENNALEKSAIHVAVLSSNIIRPSQLVLSAVIGSSSQADKNLY